LRLSRKCLFFAPLLCCISLLYAQAPDTLWTKTYGGTRDDEAYSVQQADDGGYIIVGLTESFGAGGYDVWLLKTDSFGDTIWTRTYGGVNDDYGTSVQQTTDGGYIIVGNTASFGAGRGDIWLIKTDSLGDTLWTRTYGDTTPEWAHSVLQTADGGYVIGGGYQWGDDYIDMLGLIKKVDAVGYELWTAFGGDDFSDIALTLDGGCIGVGGVYDSHQFWFIFVRKVDSLGNYEWGHTYFNYYLSWGSSIQQTKDEGYIILGYTNNQLLLFKTDHQGNVLWDKTYGGASGSSVIEVIRNGYIVTGAFASRRTRDPDLFLMRTDSLGDTLWTKTYGGNRGYSVQQTADGGYVIVGRAGDPGYYDIYLVKTALDTFSIEEYEPAHQLCTSLLHIYPNPFYDKVDIRYQITDKSEIDIDIYDATGRLVKELKNTQPIIWDGSDNLGKKLPTGVYFLEFKAGDYLETRKLILLK